MAPLPPSSPLFPYTTLFRSDRGPLERLQRGQSHGLVGLVRELRHLSPLVMVTRGAQKESDRAAVGAGHGCEHPIGREDRKSTRLNSSHLGISYAVFCLKKKK